jgi:hypothetical protein
MTKQNQLIDALSHIPFICEENLLAIFLSYFFLKAGWAMAPGFPSTSLFYFFLTFVVLGIEPRTSALYSQSQQFSTVQYIAINWSHHAVYRALRKAIS